MRRHRLDPLSLVFGLLFVALAVVGLLDALSLSVLEVRLLGPGVLVAAGVALVITAARDRRDSPPAPASGGDAAGAADRPAAGDTADRPVAEGAADGPGEVVPGEGDR